MEEKKKIVSNQTSAQAQIQTPSQAGRRDSNLKIVDRLGMVKKLSIKNTKGTIVTIFVSFLVVLAGIGTGWLLSGRPLSSSPEGLSEEISGAGGGKTEAGISDEETFRDSAEGLLVEGGIDGEGTHHLDRGMGPGKDVYLTSTVIDLQSFVDKKVKVWGETISAQKAGWLMDVGKIKVIQ